MLPSRAQLTRYLAAHHQQPVSLRAVESLDGQPLDASGAVNQGIKTYGYGKPLLLRYAVGGDERRAVLRTMAANPFGHERRSDRAAALLLAYDTFNALPRQVPARDVGVIGADGALHSLGDGDEFFLFTDYAPGTLYADDLQQLCEGAPGTARDLWRARALAAYLADIHALRCNDSLRSTRHLRDVLGSGEGVLGLSDSYPLDVLPDPCWLLRLEQRCVRWRWRIKQLQRPAVQLHGDFHPFNLLFDDDNLAVLDRSRGGWGEAADDVTCLAINYLFFSLQRSGQLAPPFDALWNTFWTTYLEGTGDEQLLAVAAPFFAWRALVLASPLWYDVAPAVRHALFRFVDNVLRAPTFDPWRANEYLLPLGPAEDDDEAPNGLGGMDDRATRIG
jgi:hypothetical protein